MHFVKLWVLFLTEKKNASLFQIIILKVMRNLFFTKAKRSASYRPFRYVQGVYIIIVTNTYYILPYSPPTLPIQVLLYAARHVFQYVTKIVTKNVIIGHGIFLFSVLE